MKQPERSNENPSQSKASAAYLGIDRTARIYAALAALLLIFVFSLSNATGGSNPQTNQPNARRGEVVLDGIRYSPLTNDKGQIIYVPTIATPEYIIYTIKENLNHIKNYANLDFNIEGKEPIETLTIEPNLEQKLTAYLFLAPENDGNAVPKTLEEIDKLGKELGYPILMVYLTFKVVRISGNTYLAPIIKYEKRTPYAVSIKIEKPKSVPVCDAEYALVIEQNPEGKRTVEIETKKRDLRYTEITVRFMKKKGIKGLGKPIYIITESPKPIKNRMIVHGCVIKDPDDPKQATTYLSAPIYRTFSDYANNY